MYIDMCLKCKIISFLWDGEGVWSVHIISWSMTQTFLFRSLVDAVYALKDEVHELKKVSETGDHWCKNIGRLRAAVALFPFLIAFLLFGHLDIYNQSLSAFNSGNEIISFFPTRVLLHVWGGGAFTHTRWNREQTRWKKWVQAQRRLSCSKIDCSLFRRICSIKYLKVWCFGVALGSEWEVNWI